MAHFVYFALIRTGYLSTGGLLVARCSTVPSQLMLARPTHNPNDFPLTYLTILSWFFLSL